MARSPYRESRVLRALKKAAKEHGLLFVRQHFGPGAEAGWPDAVLVALECVVFVETKAPGGKPRPLQEERIRALRDMGQWVEVVDTVEKARALARRVAEVAPYA